MKKTITEKDIELESDLTLSLNRVWIFNHMVGDDSRLKCQIINIATDKFGFNKVKECIVDDFEEFGLFYFRYILLDLFNDEKNVSKYMNVSRRVLDRICENSRLAEQFHKSEQFKQLKTRIIHDVKKCRTKDQMLEMFQGNPETPIVVGFLRYCFSEENWVTA